jgi:hypothetical protein
LWNQILSFHILNWISADSFTIQIAEIAVIQSSMMALLNIPLIVYIPGFNILHYNLIFSFSPRPGHGLFSFLLFFPYPLAKLSLNLFPRFSTWKLIILFLYFQLVYFEFQRYFNLMLTITKFWSISDKRSQSFNFLWVFFEQKWIVKNVNLGLIAFCNNNMNVVAELHVPFKMQILCFFCTFSTFCSVHFDLLARWMMNTLGSPRKVHIFFFWSVIVLFIWSQIDKLYGLARISFLWSVVDYTFFNFAGLFWLIKAQSFLPTESLLPV